jgi:uncharacterized membrane protein/protein-disulfide isomerase
MISFKKIQNADAAVALLLKNLGIHVPIEAIEAELEKHPDYPSLLAISDVLTNFNISNAAYRINAENLNQVPCPFIAHLRKGGGEFIVVNKLDTENVVYTNDKGKEKLKLNEFNKIFGGIVLTIEKDGQSSTLQHKRKLSFADFHFLAIIICAAIIMVTALLFHSSYLTNLTWQRVILTIFKTSGLVTSVLLLIQSIDGNNPLVQKLCQSAGESNCNAILSSKAANVFKGISWSEVGFFYFTGTWLILLFGGSSTLSWFVLTILNLGSLPYTVYSIYYQARIAKQWCVLCCTVQAFLWLEFAAFVPSLNNFHFLSGGWVAYSSIIICLLVPVVFWVILKPLLLQLQQIAPLKSQLRAFKYNTELFNRVLTAQVQYAMPADEWSIILGNVEASHIITMVTNPYCPPCSKTHILIDEWLNQTPNLQVRIVFTASNDVNDIKTPVSRHLMALNELPDKNIVRNALHDWFGQKQKNYEAWAKKYPVPLNEAEFYKIDRQNEWCQMAEVTATPTLLLNGYRLPEMYQLPDLKYMLE